MADQNIIVINGNEFSFERGESILDVARRNSIDIPTLCHLKGATATGACRVCVVEVQGARSLVASQISRHNSVCLEIPTEESCHAERSGAM